MRFNRISTGDSRETREIMSDRYSLETKAVLEKAASIARSFGHGYLGTQHILAALLYDKEGVPAQAMLRHKQGFSYQNFLSASSALFKAEEPAPADTELLGSPFTDRVMALACRQADQFCRDSIEPEHFMLAIIEFIRQRGSLLDPASQVLTRLGVKTGELRQTVVDEILRKEPLTFL